MSPYLIQFFIALGVLLLNGWFLLYALRQACYRPLFYLALGLPGSLMLFVPCRLLELYMGYEELLGGVLFFYLAATSFLALYHYYIVRPFGRIPGFFKQKPREPTSDWALGEESHTSLQGVEREAD